MTPRRYSIGAAASLLLAAGLACTLSGAPAVPPTPAEEAVAAGTTLPQTTDRDTPAPASPVPTLTPWPTPEAPVITSDELRLADLYARVNPSVVSILAELGGGEVSQGSGFVFDTSGHIVTNQHVVEGAQNLEVDFASGLKLRGEVIGADPHSDLAVIRVQGPTEELAPLPLADSDQVRVGQTVVAIGNPFGLAGTMTVGILSGLGRALASNQPAVDGGSFTAPDILQTDAAINPGNSGGPLINLRGEVVGLNTLIVRREGQADVEGFGFAIPSNVVNALAEEWIDQRPRGCLGITFAPLDPDVARRLNLGRATGAYVSGLADAAGAGARAGLREGDVITAVDGVRLDLDRGLRDVLWRYRAGDSVTLTVDRAGQPFDATLVLDRCDAVVQPTN